MHLECKKSAFALNPDVHYLNGAAYSPALQKSVDIGIQSLRLKSETPYAIRPEDHFETADRIRRSFAQLIGEQNPQRIALIPSASYGMAVVAKNLPRWPDFTKKKNIVLIGDEFPNNVYTFERVCQDEDLELIIVPRPDDDENNAEQFNHDLLDAITDATALVVASQVHWIYGTLFNLAEIGKRCRQSGAMLVIDATQSAGAYPLNMSQIQPDAVICAAYKWLLGPYGTGVACFGAFFDEGIPLEESWMNRVESERFAELTRYRRAYRPAAQRYNAGEYSQFSQLPMLAVALEQLVEWGAENIQAYCRDLCEPWLSGWQDLGCHIEQPGFRAAHLFRLELPGQENYAELATQLAERNVHVAVRGNGLRVSPNVYNTREDLAALTDALSAA